ncbi:MAG: ATP-binding cassette domain-containing protein [Syntrophotaleaceae bacterium]
MSSTTDIIEVSGLTAGYGAEPVLQDVNFSVRRGEIFIILGGSGCGKSTLLKHMIGLYTPISGRVRIDGDDIVAAAGPRRLAILRKIGVMYQNGALFGSMTVMENLCLPLEEFTDLPAEARTLIAAMNLSLVGLDKSGHLLPAELSGGMRKRAAIARAMVLGPEIIFLDEPSAGLDPVISAEMDELILRLADSLGITFVIVSHELSSIFAIADRVILLDRKVKGILADGAPEVLASSSDPAVRRFFHPRDAVPDH